MPAPWMLPHKNEHDVDCVGGVPQCCLGCVHLEEKDFDDAGNTISNEYCMVGVILPVRKGTCKRRKEYNGE